MQINKQIAMDVYRKIFNHQSAGLYPGRFLFLTFDRCVRLASIFAAISASCFLFARLLMLILFLLAANAWAATDMKAKLNTTDGSSSFDITDSADMVVGKVDSDGNALFLGSVTVRGLGVTSGSGNLDLRAPADMHLKYGDTAGAIYMGLAGSVRLEVSNSVNASSFSATSAASTSTVSGSLQVNNALLLGASNSPKFYADGASGWTRYVAGIGSGGWAFRDTTDSSDKLTLDTAGILRTAGSLSVGIAPAEVSTLTASGDLRLNGNLYLKDTTVYFRPNDTSHGIGYSAAVPDGPEIWGWDGVKFGKRNGGSATTARINNTGLYLGATQTDRYLSDDATNGRMSFSSSVYITGNLYGQSSGMVFMPVMVASHSYVATWYDAADNTTYTDAQDMTITIVVPFAPAIICASGQIMGNTGNGQAGIQFDTQLLIDNTTVAESRSQDSVATDNKNMTNNMFGLKRVTASGSYAVKIQYKLSANATTSQWNGARSVTAFAFPSQ